MWDRGDMKRKGKAAFQRNYWNCVIAALILAILLGGTTSAVRNNQPVNQNPGYAASQSGTLAQIEEGIVSLVLGAVTLSFAAAGLALKILVFNPLEVGGGAFFFHNTLAPASLGDLLQGFRQSYSRNVGAMLLRNVFIALWSLLLVIPGIVKAYGYMLLPYILADSPELSASEAMDLSQKLMYGSKWKAFMLDLSFIGWYILNVFTVGLLGVLYVNPYVRATKAELYRTLRYSTYV